MKYILWITLFFISSFSFAQTQLEMNQEADASYKKTDKELNSVYNKILVQYKDSPAFLTRLRESQRIWISFRDAELNMRYPEPRQEYGSIHPVCVSNYLASLTNTRINVLKEWLTGTEEGDVCSGSVRTKE